MKAKSRQSGVTLTEMTVVVAVIALLVTFGLPAIRAFRGAFESGGSVKGLISAGLATARAIAAREHRYAGIRCQQDLHGYQYMIFIIHDPTLAATFPVPLSGFRAVEGLKPVRLPETVGMAEAAEYFENFEGEGAVDATTFSVVFSPTGKLIIRNVQVLRRSPDDTVFNDPSKNPMFADDYENEWPLEREPSRNSLTIYNRALLNKLDMVQRSEYLQSLEPIYINPYTGTIISVD